MITIEQKDAVLKFVCERCRIEAMNPVRKAEAKNILGMDRESVGAILAQFDRMGLINDFWHDAHSFYFVVFIEAHDYYRHGGFKAQEELLTKNIQKLILELEQLKPDIPERAGLIAGIAGNIATALGLFI